MRHTVLLLGVAALATGCFRVVAPRAEVAAPSGSFSHDVWAGVLQERVSEDGLIDYAGLQNDRASLDSYVALLASASPDSHPELFPTTDAQLAYWLNAYNALAVTGVIDRPGLVSVGEQKFEFFYRTQYPLGGTNTSLYTLENSIIRKRFNDPRIHFALNCQSAGCPTFPNTPFPVEGLNEVLEDATQTFMKDPNNVRASGDAVELSEILKWYSQDFDETGGSYVYVRRYRPDLPEDADVTYIPYDWTLIAQANKGP